jgi:hypothetical protein
MRRFDSPNFRQYDFHMLRDGQLLCDLCTQAYPAGASERFAYRGQVYELDLCDPHVHKLGRVLEEFVAAAHSADDGTLTSEGDQALPGDS